MVQIFFTAYHLLEPRAGHPGVARLCLIAKGRAIRTQIWCTYESKETTSRLTLRRLESDIEE